MNAEIVTNPEPAGQLGSLSVVGGSAESPKGTGWFEYQDTARIPHIYFVYVGIHVEGRRLVATTTQGNAFWIDDMPGRWRGPFESMPNDRDEPRA